MRRKIYIPPKERRWHKKAWSVSLTGLSVSLLLLLCMVSIIFAVQASFIESQVKITNRGESRQYKIEESRQHRISDQIFSSQAETEVVSDIATQEAISRVSSFPLEKAWPVRGHLTTFFSGYHPAIDIATIRGTPVRPFASGVVTRASWWGGYGNCVVIRHTGGWESLYSHLDSIWVVVNQEVGLETALGAVGSTGWSTGPHLHFQLTSNGRAVNPLHYLPP